MKKSVRKSRHVPEANMAGAAPADKPASGYVGKPLDGSQYVDVIEEQEYADRRPSPEEQRPRFSYTKH